MLRLATHIHEECRKKPHLIPHISACVVLLKRTKHLLRNRIGLGETCKTQISLPIEVSALLQKRGGAPRGSSLTRSGGPPSERDGSSHHHSESCPASPRIRPSALETRSLLAGRKPESGEGHWRLALFFSLKIKSQFLPCECPCTRGRRGYQTSPFSKKLISCRVTYHNTKTTTTIAKAHAPTNVPTKTFLKLIIVFLSFLNILNDLPGRGIVRSTPICISECLHLPLPGISSLSITSFHSGSLNSCEFAHQGGLGV